MNDGPSIRREAVAVMDVPCPHCGALPHKPCVTASGNEVRYIHEMRAALAKPSVKIRGN